MSAAAPEPGEELVVGDRPARVTAVNVDAGTFCVMYLDNVNQWGHGDRDHDIPLGALGQEWVCEAPRDG